jgi:hypothetical protein
MLLPSRSSPLWNMKCSPVIISGRDKKRNGLLSNRLLTSTIADDATVPVA